MKRFRTLVASAAAGAVALSMLPGPSAQAADAAVFVFTAPAEVGKTTYAPGLGDPAVNSSYKFGTDGRVPNRTGIGGQTACVAVSTAGNGPCQIGSNGSYGPGLGGVGAYCGYSSGSGTVDLAKINGTSVLPGTTKLEWPQSAGTVLPLTYRTASGTIIGVGAVQTTGAEPGTCGVPEGTKWFAVTGWSATVV